MYLSPIQSGESTSSLDGLEYSDNLLLSSFHVYSFSTCRHFQSYSEIQSNTNTTQGGRVGDKKGRALTRCRPNALWWQAPSPNHVLTDCSHKKIVSASILQSTYKWALLRHGVNLDTSSVSITVDTSSNFPSSEDGRGGNIILFPFFRSEDDGMMLSYLLLLSHEMQSWQHSPNVADCRAVARFGLGSWPVRPWLDHLDLGVRVETNTM